jgi:putative sterol carrier protein
MSDMTCQDIFQKHIPERLAKKPEVAKQINNAYQFDLTGDGGGKWVVDLRKPSDHVSEGSIENPGVTVTMAATDFMAMVSGKLNGQMAFMQGKLKIKGDMSLALKLQQILG